MVAGKISFILGVGLVSLFGAAMAIGQAAGEGSDGVGEWAGGIVASIHGMIIARLLTGPLGIRLMKA